MYRCCLVWMIQGKSQWLRSSKTFPKSVVFFHVQNYRNVHFFISFCSISILSKFLDTLVIDVCHHNKRAWLTTVSKTKGLDWCVSGLIDSCQSSVNHVSLSSTPLQEISLHRWIFFLSLASRFFSHHGDKRVSTTPHRPINKPMRGVRTPLSQQWPKSLNSRYRNT